MSQSESNSAPGGAAGFDWPLAFAAEDFLRAAVTRFLERNGFARTLAARLRAETGTDLFEWIDHLTLPESDEAKLRELGFEPEKVETRNGETVLHRARATLPRVVLAKDGAEATVALHPERVADFIAAHSLAGRIEGAPLSRLRRFVAGAENGTRLEVVERNAYQGFVSAPVHMADLKNILEAQELWRVRRRHCATDADGFAVAAETLSSVIKLVGQDRACQYFFEEERRYWESRNHAAQIQKRRQDQLGLGWGNHDHHTFRCSRERFVDAVEFFQRLGFSKRERYYAGADAGWGAQIMEQPTVGVVVFADVDLMPEETDVDFSTQRLPAARKLGTVGLWVGLHGESFLEAGMHHLEARFDFDALRDQLEKQGVRMMKPFSDFQFLRQAFSEGERWPVPAARLDHLRGAGLITPDQYESFSREGALGSHLENLQRRGGFKGFNQKSVSVIIGATDPGKTCKRPSSPCRAFQDCTEMDYKNTLNLPQTGFAMKADLVKREPARLAQWEAARLYQKIQERRAGAEKFVLHDGPPFANGDVHIGTALNKILKDIIVKYHSLRGKQAPYVPGWDCHGLPIEYKVTQEMRKAGQTTADAGTVRRACEAYAHKFIDLQRTQFKRLGNLGDWENPYLTLDKQYEADELRLFADVVEKGFVYRGKKPVYWSIPARTALAEAEVEYHDHTSQSIYVRFAVVGQPRTFVVIWTTTPWTLPANLAVAYNSTLTYTLVNVAGDRYWVLSSLVPTIAEKCQWSERVVERTALGAELAGMEYQHPFCRRTGKLYAGDSFVESSAGTGFVHIAPGHGLDDYNLGRQNGLPIYSPVNDDGALTWTNDLPVEQQMPQEMTGLSLLEKHGKSDANVAILRELRARHALLHEEDYHHSYPYCWRSKTPIIFRAMDQWFIQLDKPASAGSTFRQAAVREIDRVHWIPEWGVNRIKSAVESRPDWCISRQRSWGVPIPAFYDAGGNALLDATIIRGVASLVEQHGSNLWFEKSAEELWALVKPANWNGPAPVAKSNDTLDVWIDSGSSSRAVLMRRPELRRPDASGAKVWQADIYLEGSDQHRGWFQSSLLLSLAANDAAPYRTVLTHGFMVDADREKISKSKQTGYEKPQTAEAYVSKYGADVVRLWVASQDYRNDIIVSDERVNKVGETYRNLRNTVRYQLSNLYDFDPAHDAVPDEKLDGLDRWVLAQFARLEQDVRQAYDNYEFHVVYQRVSQFAAVELSAIYHDIVKDRLYTDAANSARRRSTQTALWRMARGLCGLLSPILSFTADEAWELIPGSGAESVHLAVWSPAPFVLDAGEEVSWRRLFDLREAVLPHLEKARQSKIIGKALEAKVKVAGGPIALPSTDLEFAALRELLNVSQLSIAVREDPALAVEVTPADGQKCERCWHWETDVGSHPDHPTICARCVAAVGDRR